MTSDSSEYQGPDPSQSKTTGTTGCPAAAQPRTIPRKQQSLLLKTTIGSRGRFAGSLILSLHPQGEMEGKIRERTEELRPRVEVGLEDAQLAQDRHAFEARAGEGVEIALERLVDEVHGERPAIDAFDGAGVALVLPGEIAPSSRVEVERRTLLAHEGQAGVRYGEDEAPAGREDATDLAEGALHLLAGHVAEDEDRQDQVEAIGLRLQADDVAPSIPDSQAIDLLARARLLDHSGGEVDPEDLVGAAERHLPAAVALATAEVEDARSLHVAAEIEDRRPAREVRDAAGLVPAPDPGIPVVERFSLQGILPPERPSRGSA